MKFFKSLVVSPKGFFSRGLLILAVFIILHFLGFRDYTCVLTGTSPTGDPGDSTAILIGICYTLLYFITITCTPILIISSFFFFILLKLFPEPAR